MRAGRGHAARVVAVHRNQNRKRSPSPQIQDTNAKHDNPAARSNNEHSEDHHFFRDLEKEFPEGSHVTLRGLGQRTEYNGRTARVLSSSNSAMRVVVVVQMDDNRTKKMRVHPEHLIKKASSRASSPVQRAGNYDGHGPDRSVGEYGGPADEVQMVAVTNPGAERRKHKGTADDGGHFSGHDFDTDSDDGSRRSDPYPENFMTPDFGKRESDATVTTQMYARMGAPDKRCGSCCLCVLDWQLRTRVWYEKNFIQYTVTGLIMINFILILVGNSQPFLLGPDLQPQCCLELETVETYKEISRVIDIIFISIFTIELMVNMFAHWFCDFWKDGWNVFDFTVITISLFFLFYGASGAEEVDVSAIRVIRALRVTRIIGKLRSLRIIVNTLMLSIKGVMVLFVLLMLIILIYSIMAISIFKDITQGGYPHIIEEWGGISRFANLGEALFSFFTIVTFEAWPDIVAPIHKEKAYQPWGTLFFISYILLSAFVMMNMFVTIFLDKMTEAKEHVKVQVEIREQKNNERTTKLHRHIMKVEKARRLLSARKADREEELAEDMTDVKTLSAKTLRQEKQQIDDEYKQEMSQFSIRQLKELKKEDDKNPGVYDRLTTVRSVEDLTATAVSGRISPNAFGGSTDCWGAPLSPKLPAVEKSMSSTSRRPAPTPFSDNYNQTRGHNGGTSAKQNEFMADTSRLLNKILGRLEKLEKRIGSGDRSSQRSTGNPGEQKSGREAANVSMSPKGRSASPINLPRMVTDASSVRT